MTETRIYELFDVVWDFGYGRWTGYHTREEAQAVLDHAKTRGFRTGHIERRTWQVEVPPEYAHLYQPGVEA